MTFLGFLISLAGGLVNLIMGRNKSTAEQLGKAEESASDEGMTVNVLEEEAMAAANAPRDKAELEQKLGTHSL